MANVFDVATYILEQQGPMTTWKLQKLVYYAQAWSLVWDDDALFDEEIEAWYGDKSPQWLSDLTHLEYPWNKAREGVPDGQRGHQIISKEDLAEYYGSLQ
jgi:uncharacterized phage-associated protein